MAELRIFIENKKGGINKKLPVAHAAGKFFMVRLLV